MLMRGVLNKLQALLFDIDGTLADTDALHLQAFNAVFAPFGHAFDRARAARELLGRSNASIGAEFLPDERPERRAAIMAQKEEVFRGLAAGAVQPLPGLMTLLDHAAAASIPVVAVTNAPRANAELILRGLGITDRFRAVIIGDELPHGKPHPLPYLEGLRAADATPDCAVAFEDSRAGIAAATAAGITTIGMRTNLGHDELIAAGAAISAAAFDEAEVLALVKAGAPR
ncbi:HAD-IA family hydrolase [Bradyrhizobium sp. 83012]|uniref:HAD-IA family hydrolase n=1 Tax=Bradyrhizobium aeschynomenes TaxID=2734909 RepID=A0ABX2CGU4_9BRAD|nr:HAD-IA family hydrolase [Bradyrhizobium aeschynomenes]NPU13253.1 HAD-IA family hydrolase [Bradyrhizobium aeschynomenes]NPU66547.1 HAD-IA family hydrolase [Bradyrhizobium aeschynomenes]NPV20258.1 HAD-IA family hydrolase [Bradyrhizobium aeschynomenes]